MAQLFVFYLGDHIESICETPEAALGEESYLLSRNRLEHVYSIVAADIEACWTALDEFDIFSLHAVNGHWELVP